MTPVQYIDYGPFGSYAPAINQAMHDKYSEKDISLLRGAYGSAAGALYAESITNFVQDSSAWVVNHVDRLLDTYTENKHKSALDFIISKKRKIMKKDDKNKDEKVDDDSDAPAKPTDEQIENLKSLKSLGINIDFLNDDKKEEDKKDEEECKYIEGGLEASGKNILILKELQDDRLKKRPRLYGDKNHVVPSDKEKVLASKIEAGLANIVEKSKAGPRDVVSVGAIREALGVKL